MILFNSDQKRLTILLNSLFIGSYLIIIGIFIFVRKYAFAAETFLGLFSYAGFMLLEKKMKFQLENQLRLFIMVSAVLNSFFGEYMGLYYSTPYHDKILHMVGTFAFALAIYSVMNKIIAATPVSRLYIFILLVSLGALVGVVMELMEYFSDVLFKTYNQFGLVDTNVDMIYDMLGGILAGLYCAYGVRNAGFIHQ
ncbi:MAG: hypothetical protein N2484_12740 [Clostridia bacterium]|nr:hypothetical protein [Clostridia bacterium]